MYAEETHYFIVYFIWNFHYNFIFLKINLRIFKSCIDRERLLTLLKVVTVKNIALFIIDTDKLSMRNNFLGILISFFEWKNHLRLDYWFIGIKDEFSKLKIICDSKDMCLVLQLFYKNVQGAIYGLIKTYCRFIINCISLFNT